MDKRDDSACVYRAVWSVRAAIIGHLQDESASREPYGVGRVITGGGQLRDESFDAGLRCKDVHSGLRNVDPNSSLLGSLNDTRIVGMAATVAGLIRGRGVVEDAQALMVVAAHQLDVNMLAFNEVIGLLEDAGFIGGVQRQGGK